MATVSLFLCLNSAHALKRSETRWRQVQRNAGYLQRDFQNYQYTACKQYNDDKTQSYFAYCQDGKIDYLPIKETRVNSLNLPAKILKKQDLEKELLLTMKNEITRKMKDQFHKLSLHYECLKYALQDTSRRSRYCSNIIRGYKESTQEYLPQMRESMAVMQSSYTSLVNVSNYGINPGTLTGLEVEDDLEHPNFDTEIEELTDEEEETLLAKREAQRLQLEEQFFMGENIEKKCKSKEARKDVYCKSITTPKLYRFIQSNENKVIDESKKYYEDIIHQYPHLPYIKAAKLPETEDGKIAIIKDSIKSLYDQAKDQFEQWENAPLEEYKSFFHYPAVVENVLNKNYEYSKLKCDILEGLHQEHGPGGSNEILRNVGIALGTLVGGGICVFTGGLGCAIGVAIVGEAASIIPEQQQLSLTQQLYRSGVVSADEIDSDRISRNLSVAMAPLSFVGLKGTQALRSGGGGLSAESHGLQSISSFSDELFDLTKALTKKHLDGLLSYQASHTNQNKKWIDMARTKGASDKDALFFDIENAAMKKLNDGLGDKNLVTSLTNLHKVLLQKEVYQWAEKYPNLDLNLYSDFKSLRFAMNGDLTPEMRAQLKREFAELSKRVNEQFKAKVDSLKAESIEIPSSMPQAQTWFKAGIGNSADQAGLAARKSRELRDVSAVDIDQLRDRIQGELGSIERLRTQLSQRLPKELIDEERGIPNIDVIEFVRKKGQLQEENPSAFREAFKKRFNSDLSRKQAKDLVGYLKQVDQFSPGLWLEKRVVANLDDAEFGGFSADFKGMGAKNLQQVAIDLAQNPKSLDETLDTLRKGEGIVTQSFDSSKNWYRDVVTKTLEEDGIKTKNLCSGDDCVSIPTQSLPDLTKEKIMRALVKHGPADGQRLSFIPPGIRPQERTLLAVHGELIEKQVRNQLTGFSNGQLPPEVLKKVAFAIDMPDQVGEGAPKLMISTSNDLSLTDSQRKIISQAYAGIMKKVNQGIAEETGKKTLYDPGALIWVKP